MDIEIIGEYKKMVEQAEKLLNFFKKSTILRYCTLFILITIIPQIRIIELNGGIPSKSSYHLFLILNYTNEISRFLLFMFWISILEYGGLEGIVFLIMFFLITFVYSILTGYLLLFSILYFISYFILEKFPSRIYLVIKKIINILLFLYFIDIPFYKEFYILYFSSITLIFFIMIILEVLAYSNSIKIVKNSYQNNDKIIMEIINNEIYEENIYTIFRVMIYFIIICKGIYIVQNTFPFKI